MTHLGRIWTLRDAVAAFALLYASGVGVIFYSPYSVTQPDSLPAYLLLCIAVGPVTWLACMSRRRIADWLATCVLVAAAVAFSTWYGLWEPIIGPTSDNTDALVVGVNQLLGLHNPWGARTFLDNVPSPMLGGFILAAPFVLVPFGIFLQQLVWYVVLVGFILRTGGLHAAAMAAVLLFVTPWTRLAVPGGSDNWIVAVAVVLAGSWGYWAVRDDRGALEWWLSSLAFGVTMSYRFTIWIAVVPLLVLFWRRFGARAAIRWFVPAGLVTAVLVVGPLLVNAQAYLDGPVAVAVDKAQFDTVAHSGAIVAVVTLLVVCAASSLVRDLAGAWLALTVGLVTLSAMVVLTKVPVVGIHAALGTYESAAYVGAWLVTGLCGLAMRRETLTPRGSDVSEP